MGTAQLGRERPGVDWTEMEVEQQRVDLLGRNRGPSLVGRPRLDDAVSVQLEVDPAEEADRGVVIDDEDGSGAGDRASLARLPEAPYPRAGGLRSLVEMAKARDRTSGVPPPARPAQAEGRIDFPTPTSSFRLRAWREFQRALDPLARPKRLPLRPR
jgi:hypothetical protein